MSGSNTFSWEEKTQYKAQKKLCELSKKVEFSFQKLNSKVQEKVVNAQHTLSKVVNAQHTLYFYQPVLF